MSINSLKTQLRKPNSRPVIAGAVFATLALSAACTNETSRRSAVDPKRLCDPANPYSTCLSTEASPSSANPMAAPTIGVRKTPPDGGGGAGGGDGGGGAGAGAGADPKNAAPAAPAAPPPNPEDERAKAQAEALRGVTGALDELGKALGDKIRNRPNSAGGSGGDGSAANSSGTYLVTFGKDSFVGIASGSVTKNCFVTSGTVIEVKSTPAKITEFASQGVNQFLARDVVSVSPAVSASGCTLTGQDFVYMGSHATFQPKP